MDDDKKIQQTPELDIRTNERPIKPGEIIGKMMYGTRVSVEMALGAIRRKITFANSLRG